MHCNAVNKREDVCFPIARLLFVDIVFDAHEQEIRTAFWLSLKNELITTEIPAAIKVSASVKVTAIIEPTIVKPTVVPKVIPTISIVSVVVELQNSTAAPKLAQRSGKLSFDLLVDFVVRLGVVIVDDGCVVVLEAAVIASVAAVASAPSVPVTPATHPVPHHSTHHQSRSESRTTAVVSTATTITFNLFPSNSGPGSLKPSLSDLER